MGLKERQERLRQMFSKEEPQVPNQEPEIEPPLDDLGDPLPEEETPKLSRQDRIRGILGDIRLESMKK